MFYLNEWNCSCNLADFGGIPCCHIIALYRLEFAEFPKFLVDPRWNKAIESMQYNEEITLDYEDIVFEFNDENIEQDIHNDENDNFDEHPDLPSTICNETYDSNSFSILSESERYLRLFHIAKPICSLASKDPDTSLKIGKKLTKMIEGLRGLDMTVHDSSTEESHKISYDGIISDETSDGLENDLYFRKESDSIEKRNQIMIQKI